MPSRNRQSDQDLPSVRTPLFRSEVEEAAWWDRSLDRLREEAIARLESRQALKPVTMRLPEGDMTLARAIAAKRGLRYRLYLQSMIHSAFESEAKSLLKPGRRKGSLAALSSRRKRRIAKSHG
jgi:predicted DNA binding CopG/RHH family protein